MVIQKKAQLRGKWYRWVAFGFGTGLSPIAPGTVGTLLGIPTVVLFQFLPDVFWFVGALLIVLMSVWSSSRVSSELGFKDHPAIVIDEISGFVVTMALIPVTWQSIALGFLLFRLFDIIKPPPAGWIDRNISGGIGITADDVVAGVYANIAMHAVLAFTDIL